MNCAMLCQTRVLYTQKKIAISIINLLKLKENIF